MSAPDYESVLINQLAMTEQAWSELQRNGVTDTSIVKLDFFFKAPKEAAANRLVELLTNETDYILQPPRTEGYIFRKSWWVTGSTQPTQISKSILDGWVAWMIDAGRRSGDCLFDGWGAEVPSK